VSGHLQLFAVQYELGLRVGILKNEKLLKREMILVPFEKG